MCRHRGYGTFFARKHFSVTDRTNDVYFYYFLLFQCEASEDSVPTFSSTNATYSKEKSNLFYLNLRFNLLEIRKCS